jgi:zinc/manganese transport system permease protein
LAVSMSAVTIGAILSTALLIGPAATALRMANRIGVAIAIASGVGVCACWVGTLLAYDSTVWAGGNGWPVSFCIVAVIFVFYFASGIFARLRGDRRDTTANGRRMADQPVETA